MKLLLVMKHFLIHSKNSVLIVLGLIISACSDDATEPNSLTFEFIAKADNEILVFDSKKYSTQAQQSISFERIQLYLSNIQIKDAKTNTYFSEPDSYHLLSFDSNQGAVSFTVENVPSDFEISEIKMAIGVDPDANESIDHVGDLDPTNNMAWDWNTGYKFLSLEGRYFEGDEPLGEEIKMHIGTDKNYTTVSVLFNEPQAIVGDFNLIYTVDAMAPFGAIDLSEGTVFMNDERGDEVAENYKDGLILLEETFGFVK